MIVTPLVASFTSAMLGILMFAVSLFLVLLILVQRGRGGGLTGALGGPGGQSAFGTKAGDLFTRITSFVALGWITLCAFTMWSLGPDTVVKDLSNGPTVSASPADGKDATKDFINLGGDKKADDATKDDATKDDATKEDAAKNSVELAPATDAAAKPEVTAPAATETAVPAETVAPAAAAPAADAPAAAAAVTEPAATADIETEETKTE